MNSTAALYILVGAATILPWVAHFGLGWWAGPVVWFALIALYDRLFVPRGSVCMGVPFMIPLASGLALVAFDAALLLKWAIK